MADVLPFTRPTAPRGFTPADRQAVAEFNVRQHGQWHAEIEDSDPQTDPFLCLYAPKGDAVAFLGTLQGRRVVMIDAETHQSAGSFDSVANALATCAVS